MRLLKKDTDKRISIKHDRSLITPDNTLGIMRFGTDNDYPQIIENIINSSVTAKSVSNIYSKFLCGQGFEKQEINDIIIGKDSRGKNITLLSQLRAACNSIAKNQGAYMHVNLTLDRKIKSAKVIPFKYCRFSKIDDNEYTAKILVYENWDKDSDKKVDKSKIRAYNVFDLNEESFVSQVKEAGDIEHYKGQVYFHFLDNEYIYPLSTFDSVYMDCDTENQVAVFKNNTTRNGMTKKAIVRMMEPENEDEEEDLRQEIENWQGSDGDNVLVLYDDIDPETGQIKTTGAFAIDTLESAIDDKLFEGWQKELTNNIRKAVKGLPAILIDYEQSNLGTTSGEAIQQAVNYYNELTKDDRQSISEMFKDIFSNFDNDTLSNNDDWTIKPLELGTNGQSNTIIQ